MQKQRKNADGESRQVEQTVRRDDDVIGIAKKNIKAGETMTLKFTPNGIESDEINVTMDRCRLMEVLLDKIFEHGYTPKGIDYAVKIENLDEKKSA